MLKTIYFDLDDTLIDWGGVTGEWRAKERRHIERVYDHLSMVCDTLDFPLDRLLNTYMERVQDGWAEARSTLRAPHMWRILSETLASLNIRDEYLDEKQVLTAYGWGMVEGTTVFPEVPDMLQHFIDRGIQIGIITNAFQPMWIRDVELAEHGLLGYFPTCRFSAADIGYLKPHSKVFQTALKCARCTAAEAIYVGDNPVADIAGAQSVGMRAALRVNHHTAPLISGLIVPDGAINSLEELPELLDEWFPGWGETA